ncbi:class A beta-lactamase [Bradyrhizobium japonicum]|uniref:class A beta-lactamase n=1 Tax=Bradyrhizobium japonicum TaxID=375 RepID=UPI000456A4EC|nr:class A beta-lactamase [Bradyrhizobium japonicum]AHY55383.1 beta-lactamase L2 precursor [Bradyrhizobium japonicum SEMIA 5079]MCD9108074.1 class A beta-lactamase [Bradyrhizobium japonicum]MCD9252479.1 class A beta-lactamase [Bradyrhizobium japonicum SEMIA 5079]MCD9816954.1 class A beta-lactamase [Bradyrhizobium japonicum]MCD9891836.1 class A beta-lactamase [Bradyrhizobium japonicum]
MPLDRRSLLASLAWMAASPALAAEAPPELESYERETGGRIGVYAENLATGAQLAWRADERFVMCSTFKASLAACVLARADRGEEQLAAMIPYGKADLLDYAPVAKQNLAAGTMSVAEMCKAIVELSDNTCANLLLARIGGPAALTAFWRSLGDTTSRLDHNEPELNRSPPGDPRDTTTPAAMAGNLKRLVVGEALSPASRTQLTEWMVGCETGANRLRGGLPAGWKIGDKTGNNGKDASGDIAVAWPKLDNKADVPILIATYTQGGTPNAAQIEAAFARVGRMVAERLA